MEDNGATFDELGNPVGAANDPSVLTMPTGVDPSLIRTSSASKKDQLLDSVFIRLSEEDKSIFNVVFEDSIAENDKESYLEHLDKYFSNESNDLSSKSLKTRLQNFESSDDFKSCPVKEKLSSRISSMLNEEKTAARNQNLMDQNNLFRAQESSIGLDANEKQMAAHTPRNATKALQNVASLAGSGSMGISNAITNLADGLIAKPAKAISGLVASGMNKVSSRNALQHQEQLEQKTSSALDHLKESVNNFCELPEGTDESLVKTHLKNIKNQSEMFEKSIRDQTRSGMNNALDDSIPDSIKKNLLTKEEVANEGEESLNSYKGLMDRMANAAALNGHDKQKEVALEMAKAASQLMKKIAVMIKGIFGRKVEAEEAGVELETSVPSPTHMAP